MKAIVFMMIFAITLSGCHLAKPHEKATQAQAEQSGLLAVAKPHFDISFVDKAVHFSQYKSVKFDKLDLGSTKVIQPYTDRIQDQPWALNDDDKRYYQEKYEEALKKALVDSGAYTLTADSMPGTLLVKGKVVDISPLGPKDDLISRPTLMDVYSRGFGRMTIAFELYDAATGKLILTASDEDELGHMWEKNNRVQNNVQVRLGFERWAHRLQEELADLRKN